MAFSAQQNSAKSNLYMYLNMGIAVKQKIHISRGVLHIKAHKGKFMVAEHEKSKLSNARVEQNTK